MEPQQASKWPSGIRERKVIGRMSTPWQRLTCLGVVLVVAGCAQFPVSGLRPQYPKARFRFGGPGGEVAYVKVDSLQPTLLWEPFPRPQDHEADKEGVLKRIRNVAYDLKILRALDNYPIELIYARQGLPEPSHSIEEPLEPSTKYFWTIRARFELDGHSRVIAWGRGRWRTVGENDWDRLTPLGSKWGKPYYKSVISWRQALVPNPFYHRFKTPRK